MFRSYECGCMILLFAGAWRWGSLYDMSMVTKCDDNLKQTTSICPGKLEGRVLQMKNWLHLWNNFQVAEQGIIDFPESKTEKYLSAKVWQIFWDFVATCGCYWWFINNSNAREKLQFTHHSGMEKNKLMPEWFQEKIRVVSYSRHGPRGAK